MQDAMGLQMSFKNNLSETFRHLELSDKGLSRRLALYSFRLDESTSPVLNES
jgi:hypothetical protein